MKKLLAVLMSSAMLMSVGYALAQPAASESSGSGMSKDQSTSDEGMTKKSKKHKKTHKKAKGGMAKEQGGMMGKEQGGMMEKEQGGAGSKGQ